ncbi:unnamed protein product [Paramecium primaurelia]|uniref:Uncharacterized protein n=1 Tax=Paramecium primaurelia TaxID=5886 RepID=A0A8S1P1E8_PARPR|nr:unnamed protein product [Paramecium primaurelia]
MMQQQKIKTPNIFFNFQFVMQDREKNQNWCFNDYCKNLNEDMIAQYLAIFGLNLLTCKPLLNALQFTDQEEDIIKTFQTSKIAKFANLILSSQTKMSAFLSLLETSHLKGTFPQKMEFGLEYPKVIPHQLVSLPKTQKCLNLRILVQMFLSSVQTKVFLLNDVEVASMFQIQEN